MSSTSRRNRRTPRPAYKTPRSRLQRATFMQRLQNINAALEATRQLLNSLHDILCLTVSIILFITLIPAALTVPNAPPLTPTPPAANTTSTSSSH